ncbi:MAG: aldehyde dehydrogenase family protein [Flavobacteriales bacterium]|nr:aldehyde dehydrogenase family protein [Flavobacteriales bacterium]
MEKTTLAPDQALDHAHGLRTYFDTGATRSYAARRNALKALRSAVRMYEEDLITAMHTDMRKPRFEAYLGDIGLVYAEIDHALKHLKEWMRPRAVPTPLAIQLAESKVYHEPLGVVLIIAPWNYPVLLLLGPLVGAIAAGNCAVLKPSEDAPATAAVVERLVKEAIPAWVEVVQGPGVEAVPQLMRAFRFDHVFFTGSARVGRAVLELAARDLVPTTLELGGKSPAIVDRTADVKRATQRIAWSKFFNAGQTCIATDHALVHAEVMEEFIDALKLHIRRFYGDDPQRSADYARLINRRRFDAVSAYLSQGDVVIGGPHDAADRYIAPTVMTGVPLSSSVMSEEIFGPVLPVIPWTERDEALAIIRRNPQPLAAYIFSNDRKAQDYFLERVAFGGGCINHCMLQFGSREMPFGGVGASGMGRYHGERTFLLFSNEKGVVHASTLIEPGVQYPPYTKLKAKVLRRFL